MRQHGIFLFLMTCLVCVGSAQKKQDWVDAANDAFFVEADYYKAYKFYEAALEYQRDTSDVLYLLYRKGESARLINAYRDAQGAYLELVRRAPADSLVKAPYRCALAHLGELELNLSYSGNEAFEPSLYQKALDYFTAYDQLAPDSGGECDELAAEGKAIIQFATQGAGKHLINALVHIENAGPDVNSTFSDFAPMAWGDRLYFTSFRHDIAGAGKQSARYFSRIYLFQQLGGKPADELPTINLTPKDTFHVGHTTFNHTRDLMYFTRCEYVDRTLTTRCDLYYHQLDQAGRPIGDPVEVSELNLKNSTLTHPAMAWDPELEREILYFASNRPGTRGKMDIWKSELVNGRFTPPTNNMVINTSGNEITPFYQGDRLYFSSDSQPDRYGGFDIFYTSDPETAEPVNLGQKINSSADDLYYSRNEDGSQAFFASNRLPTATFGMVDGQQPAGSLDIYYYAVLEAPCTLEVNAFSHCTDPVAGSLQALDNVTVTLFDITDGAEVSNKKGIAPILLSKNSYRFENVLQYGRKYLVIGNKAGYGEERQVLDFTGSRRPCANGAEAVSLYFNCDQPVLEVQVYHQNRRVPGATVRIVAMSDTVQLLGKNLLPKQVEGSQIPCPDTLNPYVYYPGEERITAFSETFPVEYERTYLVIADPRMPDSLLIGAVTYRASRSSKSFCGASCRDTLRIDLDALPGTQLFFENGAPGPHPLDVSGSSFLMTLYRYQQRKEAYLDLFPLNSESELDLAVRNELELFFSDAVEMSFPNLSQFMQQATSLLCHNVPITIEARACATPKSIPQTRREQDYMTHLANRRTHSIQQDLIGFGLSARRWPRLYQFETQTEVCEEPDQADELVKDAWLEQENAGLSPFSIDAARARKVELRLRIGHGPRKDNAKQSLKPTN